MAGKYMVIGIVVLQGMLFAEAANMGRCFDILLSTTTETSQCSSVDDFTKCVIQELQLFQTRVSQSEITNLENIVKRNLAESGLHCKVDFRAIIMRIQEEREKGITYATRRPTGFSDARTKGDCLNTLITSNTAVSGVDCALVAPFVKCIIRVTEYYKNIHTLTEDSSLLTDVQDHFGQLQVYCTIDIPVLSEEVAREIATSARSATPTTATTTPTTATTTPTTATTISTTQNIISTTPNTKSTTPKTIFTIPKTISTTSSTVSTTQNIISTTPNTKSTTPKAISITATTVSNVPAAMHRDRSKTAFTTSPNVVQPHKLLTCLSSLSQLHSSGANHCFSVKEFVTCLLDELNLFKCNMTDRGMGDFAVLVMNHIKMTAVQCDNDITTIIRKAQKDDCKRITQTTSSPLGPDSRTLTACWQAYYPIDFRTVVSPCTELSKYMKCLIEVSRAYSYKQYCVKLQAIADKEILLYGWSCSIDVSGLCEQVDREHPWNSGATPEMTMTLLLSLLIIHIIWAVIH